MAYTCKPMQAEVFAASECLFFLFYKFQASYDAYKHYTLGMQC